MAEQAPAAAPAAAPSSSSGSASRGSSPSTSSTPSSSSSAASRGMTSADFRASLRSGANLGTEPAQSNSFEDAVSSQPAGLPDIEAPDFAAQETEPAVEEVSPDAETAEQDWSWAEPLAAYKEGLHGLQLQELLTALQEGRIPEQLWDKLRIPLKDGEYEWEDTISAARNGAMMRENYTRKLQQFAKERDSFQAEKTELVDYLRSWKEDPAKLLAGLTRMGMPVEQMARRFAENYARVEHLRELEAAGTVPPGTADALLAKEQQDAELEELRAQQARAQAQTQNQQSEAQTQQIAQAVRQESINQLAQVGFKVDDGSMTEGVWNLYREHLSAIWTAKGAPPNRAEIQQAALATKQQVARYVQQHASSQQKQAPAAQQQLGKAPLDGGAPKNTPRSPTKGVTAKEFRNSLRGNNWR